MNQNIPSTPPSESNLLRELEWVHSLVRRDLQVCQTLAHEVTAGAAATEIQAQIQSLQTKSPLWQLRVNCLYYCHFVHMHHGHEDAHFFPMLRRVNADLNPVIDKLEADHRKVSDLLDDIEAYANEMVQADSGAARARLVRGLNLLATELLAHLDYEEQALGPTLLQMRR